MALPGGWGLVGFCGLCLFLLVLLVCVVGGWGGVCVGHTAFVRGRGNYFPTDAKFINKGRASMRCAGSGRGTLVCSRRPTEMPSHRLLKAPTLALDMPADPYPFVNWMYMIPDQEAITVSSAASVLDVVFTFTVSMYDPPTCPLVKLQLLIQNID
ncbi:hypothetical protein J6590_101603 [Homalodisca vitripennis]|nr:hypothetical protein J6590_101603 [Homalodisca vitripennis]